MLEIIREARDRAFQLATFPKKTVEIDRLRYSLDCASPRMRYVMFRGYERGDARMALRVLSSDDKVLECGAAIGFMALNLIRGPSKITDYCMVEANAALLSEIAKNFALNKTPMPELIHAAVGPEDGEISFGVNRNFWSSSTIGRSQEHRVTVPALSIPTILSKLDFTPTTLIMDIEGGEKDIPFEHFLLFDKIIIETHPALTGDLGIFERLEANGYREKDRNGNNTRAYLKYPRPPLPVTTYSSPSPQRS